MKFANWKILLAMLAMASFFLVSCDETTEPEPEDFTPKAPTNLMATSLDKQSIRIKWTHSEDVANAEFKEYEIAVTGGAAMDPVTRDKESTTYELTGLNEGTIYTFSIYSVSTKGKKSTAATIQWSPSSRFTLGAPMGANTARMYESASSFGSGMELYFVGASADESGPRTRTVADGVFWDIGLDTRNSKLHISSAKLLDYNFGTNKPTSTVEISSQVLTGYATLDEVYGSEGLDKGTFSEKAVDLSTYNGNIVLVLRHKKAGETKWHYAKLFVKYFNGSFLQGATGNRYVEVVLSYQMGEDVPYAKINKVN